MRGGAMTAAFFLGALPGVGAAHAAEPSAPPTLAWQGFYFGGQAAAISAGSGWRAGGVASSDSGFADLRARDGQFGPLVGGFEAGYNAIFANRFLLGFELDASFADVMESGRFAYSPFAGAYQINDKIEMSGTARARAGVASGNWLAYATGGLAIARDRIQRTQFVPGMSSGFAAAGDVDTAWRWRYGFSLGAGVEARLSPDWSAKLEYLYSQFGRSAVYFPLAQQTYASDLRAHQVRLGLNYHFGEKPEDAPKGLLGDMENWSIHGQSTFVAQNAFAFPARYSGANSLSNAAQLRETFSATAFVGVRLPTGTELYYNPEPFQGFGLSGTHGVAAFPNNEAQKAGFNYPHYNSSRLFVRQVFGLGGETEKIEDGQNQVAGEYDVSRITLIAGKMSVPDFFDNNAYSHDARTSFMNWALVDAGAFDYAADQKGYTWGAVAELNQKRWAARAGYFLQPTEPNGNVFDTRLVRRGQYVGELEGRYTLPLLDQPGKIRFTGWYSRAVAGSFDEAVYNPIYGGDITQTRRNRPEWGYVANLEQALTDDLGLFARWSWRSGTTEVVAWTDIDRSLSAGAVMKGTAWGRPQDKVGVAGVVSGLSGAYRRYLALGGLGLNIGDGALTYRRENALETYYAIGLAKWAVLTFDYQFVANPGYNADRGPVSIASVRFHTEF
ncbi:MAG: carbohydrate porin [Hyphomicrobiales bacterium]|nr:carbohydrate porin [Hyphomicrobiales bacterium]